MTECVLTGPTAAPEDFNITAVGPTSLLFSWSPPPEEERNGIIILYNLTCQAQTHNISMIFSTAGVRLLDGFRPATAYNCSLYSATSGGSGPQISHTIATFDGGMHNVILQMS